VYGVIGRGLSRRRLFLWGWLLTALIVYGALSAQLPLTGIVLAGVVSGIVAGPINPIVETVLHENTPPRLMGRVFGALTAFAQVGIPFGAAIAGLAIESAGLIPTIAVMGALYVVFVAFMFANPALRGMDLKAPSAEEAPAVAPTPMEVSSQARNCPTMKAGL
jgi:MFS family permease